MNEWVYVISTVNTLLGVNILDPGRGRRILDARAIYYHIMRNEFGKTLGNIGKHIGKDHATVLHSLKNFDVWIKLDTEFRNNYKRVLDIVREGDIPPVFDEEYIKKIQDENHFLMSENELLTLQLENKSNKIKQLEREALKFSFYSDLFERIMHMGPSGKEEELSRRINTFLNGVQLR